MITLHIDVGHNYSQTAYCSPGMKGKWMLVITSMELLTWQVRKMGQEGVGGSLKVSDRAEINSDISPSGL